MDRHAKNLFDFAASLSNAQFRYDNMAEPLIDAERECPECLGSGHGERRGENCAVCKGWGTILVDENGVEK